MRKKKDRALTTVVKKLVKKNRKSSTILNFTTSF